MRELFRSPRRALVWIVEAGLLALLVVGVAGLMLGWAQALGAGYFLRALGITAIAQGSIYYHGLYGPGPIARRGALVDFVRALGAAALVLWILVRLVPQAALGQGVLVAALGGAVVVLPAWRAAYQRIASRESFLEPTVILGGGPLARACAALIQGDRELGLRLAAVLVHEDEPAASVGLAIAGSYAALGRICREQRVERVVVAVGDRRGRLPMEELLDLKLRGVNVEDGLDLYERAAGRIYVPGLRPSQILFCCGFHVRRRTRIAKRAVDVAFAVVGLVLAAPVMALAALAIKLDSPGPVLYSQLRAGALGARFMIHKLRSMRTDAEACGAVWAAENDPRVTRVGAFLRKARIDELPQLWNVLVGEMSLVGPRPERPIFVERLEREIPFFRQRLAVKPGVTGHAQVRARYAASTEDHLEKLEYDLFYIKSVSLWFDLSILLDTVKVVLLRIGAR